MKISRSVLSVGCSSLGSRRLRAHPTIGCGLLAALLAVGTAAAGADSSVDGNLTVAGNTTVAGTVKGGAFTYTGPAPASGVSYTNHPFALGNWYEDAVYFGFVVPDSPADYALYFKDSNGGANSWRLTPLGAQLLGTAPTWTVFGKPAQTSDIFRVVNGAGSSYLKVGATGNVGIGTTAAPVGRLHVQGDPIWDSYTTLNLVNGSGDYGRTQLRMTGRLQDGNDGFAITGRNNLIFAVNASATGANLGAVGVDKFALQYNMVEDKLGIVSSTGGATPLMVWQQNGYVGIGTKTPVAPLEVNGNAQVDGNVLVGGDIAGSHVTSISASGVPAFYGRQLGSGFAHLTNAVFHGVTDNPGGAGGYNWLIRGYRGSTFKWGADFDGVLSWSGDTNLYRSAAGSLKTDGALSAASLTVGGIAFGSPNDYVKAASGGSVGIGTTSPLARLDVTGSNPTTSGRVLINDDGGYLPQISTYKWSGTGTTYYGNRIINSNAGDMTLQVAPLANMGAHTFIDAMTITQSGNVAIGVTTPAYLTSTNGTQYKLSVEGKIHAKEVVVDTDAASWSDYVFAANYRNAPLAEVEQHIKEHGHLPGIPSAGEVEQKGVNVGQMQALLLAKVEELTLHLIEQEKSAKAQESRLLEQDHRLQRLEQENAALRASR